MREYEVAKNPPDIVTGRRALVTGASSGIGKSFAVRLAQDHYDLVLVARDQERLEEIAGELRTRYRVGVKVMPSDLTKTVSLRKVVRFIEADEHLEILVNNAGFGTMGKFAELDPSTEENQVRLNVIAPVRLTRAALPKMIERHRGAIINVSSMAGLQPGPSTATYSATKAFINTFTEGICEEISGTGVQIQVLCPGFTRTRFQERANIDASAVPEIAWMESDAVVAASFDGLRRGEVVCVPGLLNRLLATVVSSVPRPVTRKILGFASRRLLH